MSNNILSLLGLALRGGRLAVGEEPAALAARGAQARLLLLASDAADNTLRRAEHLAGEGHCLWLVLPFSKAELGGALGRGSAAIAALTDVGLAAAVTERLAALDPERYGEAARRMDLKRRRAKERQSAPHRPPPEERQGRRPPSSRPQGPSRRDGPGDARRHSRGGGANGGAPGGGRASQGGPDPGRGGRSARAPKGKTGHPHFERPGRAASDPSGGSRPRNGTRNGGGKRRPPKDRGGSGRGGGR